LARIKGAFRQKGGAALTFVLVDRFFELGNSWGDLQSLQQDTLLPLHAHVLWPLHESGEVSLWLDVTSQTEVARVLLEQGALSSARTRGFAAIDDNLLSCFLDLKKAC